LQKQGNTNLATNGTHSFHGSNQHPFLKKCTILHCIPNLPSQFSLRCFLDSQPVLRNVWNLELSTMKLWQTKKSLND